MIAILDYGSGNLRSAQRAFEVASANVVVTRDAKTCSEASALIVPGVGAFAACMEQLAQVGGVEIIADRVAKARPIFGICVGMQILFQSSSEKKETQGLGVLPGKVSELKAPVLPHMGWNSVAPAHNSKLFKGVEDQSFYFVILMLQRIPSQMPQIQLQIMAKIFWQQLRRILSLQRSFTLKRVGRLERS